MRDEFISRVHGGDWEAHQCCSEALLQVMSAYPGCSQGLLGCCCDALGTSWTLLVCLWCSLGFSGSALVYSWGLSRRCCELRVMFSGALASYEFISRVLLGCSWDTLEALGEFLGCSSGAFGMLLGSLGVLLVALGVPLVSPGVLWECSWDALGCSWGL